jgi:hypothetical protein
MYIMLIDEDDVWSAEAFLAKLPIAQTQETFGKTLRNLTL